MLPQQALLDSEVDAISRQASPAASPPATATGGGMAGAGLAADDEAALRSLFAHLDRNGDNFVDKGELLKYVREGGDHKKEILEASPRLAGLLKPQHFGAEFQAIDTDKDGHLTFEELLVFCSAISPS